MATIDPKGCITLFGRKENLIYLQGLDTPINPVQYERQIKNISGVKSVIVFNLNGKLHAAIQFQSESGKSNIINAIKGNTDINLISSLSFWNEFPLTLGGKIDRNHLIEKIKCNEISVVYTSKASQDNYAKFRLCQIL